MLEKKCRLQNLQEKDFSRFSKQQVYQHAWVQEEMRPGARPESCVCAWDAIFLIQEGPIIRVPYQGHPMYPTANVLLRAIKEST